MWTAALSLVWLALLYLAWHWVSDITYAVHWLARSVFSVSFATCCYLMLLLLVEITDSLGSQYAHSICLYWNR